MVKEKKLSKCSVKKVWAREKSNFPFLNSRIKMEKEIQNLIIIPSIFALFKAGNSEKRHSTCTKKDFKRLFAQKTFFE